MRPDRAVQRRPPVLGGMVLRNSVIAAIRTGVALFAAWLIATLLGFGVELDPGFEATLTTALFAVAVAGYNFVVNFLATNVHPAFGFLLGIPVTPSYADGAPAVTESHPAAQREVNHHRDDGATTGEIALWVAAICLVLLVLFAVFGAP